MVAGERSPTTAFPVGTRASDAPLRQRQSGEEGWRGLAAVEGGRRPESPPRGDDAGAKTAFSVSGLCIRSSPTALTG